MTPIASFLLPICDHIPATVIMVNLFVHQVTRLRKKNDCQDHTVVSCSIRRFYCNCYRCRSHYFFSCEMHNLNNWNYYLITAFIDHINILCSVKSTHNIRYERFDLYKRGTFCNWVLGYSSENLETWEPKWNPGSALALMGCCPHQGVMISDIIY